MDWLFAVIGFIVQLLSCIHGKSGMGRGLPLLIAGTVTGLTLLLGLTSGFFGLAIGMVLFWAELKILFAMGLAWVIYKLVLFTK